MQVNLEIDRKDKSVVEDMGNAEFEYELDEDAFEYEDDFDSD